MRRFLLCFAVLAGCGAGGEEAVSDAAFASDAAVEPDAAPGPDLRLNHLQARGTHNSYHLPTPLDIPELKYEHRPLDEQLENQGVRQFELDVHWDPATDRFLVHHIPRIDENSTCPRLADCLGLLKAWSDAHPAAHALFVFLEPKDDVDRYKIHDHFPALEADVLSVWPRERIVTPDDVRGARASLSEAIALDGWPSIEATRGKIVLVLLDEAIARDRYLAWQPDLRGRLLFPLAPADHPQAAFFSENSAATNEAAVRDLVARGFVVRTLVEDEAESAAALRAGAHLISTDHPDALDLGDGAPSRCNPVSAPPDCAAADLD